MAGYRDRRAHRPPHRPAAGQYWLPHYLPILPPSRAVAYLARAPFCAGYRTCASIAPSARRNFPARSLLVLPSVSAGGKRWFRRLASALDEGPLDMMFGNELNDGF